MIKSEHKITWTVATGDPGGHGVSIVYLNKPQYAWLHVPSLFVWDILIFLVLMALKK